MTKDKPTEPPFKSLPWNYELENAFMILGSYPWCPLAVAAVWHWLYNTWKAQHRTWTRRGRQGRFIPTYPHKFKVFNWCIGMSCGAIKILLNEWGISSISTSLTWELWPDRMGIGMVYSFYVPAPQWEMADAILAQNAGSYSVISKAGSKRGYKFTKPWGVPAKPRSWQDAVEAILFGRAMRRAKLALKIGSKQVVQKRRKS